MRTARFILALTLGSVVMASPDMANAGPAASPGPASPGLADTGPADTGPADTGPPVVSGGPHAIAGQYIVMLKPGAPSGVTAAATTLSDRVGGHVVTRFSQAVRGFTVRTSASGAARLAKDPRVARVYQDVRVHVGATQRVPAPPASPWGLDRIDQRKRRLNHRYRYRRGARNVRAYVIDTGIRTSHREFGGRATFGYTARGLGRPGVDCNGHGTHVAGTIGGKRFGVAKHVRLVAVKVLNCNGSASASQVIEGIDWVTRNAVRPAVANMSLGTGYYPPLNAAVAASIRAGITYVVAAGNSGANASNFSPASTRAAITVASTGRLSPTRPACDARSIFSNYGAAVDLFAPGTYIRSAWHRGNRSARTLSGTSMASPHVAGAAALYLSRYPRSSPATVRNALVARSTKHKVKYKGRNSPNRLLFALI